MKTCLKNLRLDFTLLSLVAALLALSWYGVTHGFVGGRSSADKKAAGDASRLSPRQDARLSDRRNRPTLIDQQSAKLSPEIAGIIEKLNSEEQQRYGDDLNKISGAGVSSPESLLYKLSQLDIERAYAWVLANPAGRRQRHYLNTLIEYESRGDLDRAWERILELRVGEKETGKIVVPSEVFLNAMALGADRYIDLCKKVVLNNGMAGYTSSDKLQPFAIYGGIPRDFDFRLALDSLQQMKGLIEDDLYRNIVPDNLFMEWSSRDARAAFQWLRDGGDLPHSDLSEVLQGAHNSFISQNRYGYSIGSKEMGMLASEVLNTSQDADAAYKELTTLFSYYPNDKKEKAAKAVSVFLDHVADERGDDYHLLNLVKNGGRPNAVILEAMSPSNRLQVLEVVSIGVLQGGFRGESPLARLRSELHRLGHSLEDIDASIEQRKLSDPAFKEHVESGGSRIRLKSAMYR